MQVAFGQAGVNLRLARDAHNRGGSIVIETPGTVGKLQIGARHIDSGLILHSLVQHHIGKERNQFLILSAQAQVRRTFRS